MSVLQALYKHFYEVKVILLWITTFKQQLCERWHENVPKQFQIMNNADPGTWYHGTEMIGIVILLYLAVPNY